MPLIPIRAVPAALALLFAAGMAQSACVELSDYGEVACAQDGTCPGSLYCLEDRCVFPGSLARREPFPCKGGSCPSPFLCVPGVGCVSPENVASYTPFDCDDGSCPLDLLCLEGVGCVPPGEVDDYIPFACYPDGTCPGRDPARDPSHLVDLRCVATLGCVRPNECDPAGANCPPERPRCDVVVHADGTTTAQCFGQPGSIGANAPCTSQADGLDDCAPGLQCIDLGTVGPAAVCREFCSEANGCAAGEACVATTSGQVCADACTLGTDLCEPGLACYPIDGVRRCEEPGTGQEHEPCISANSCAEGLWCSQGTCERACDETLACPDDATCVPGPIGACYCEPFGDYCGSGDTCLITGADGVYFTHCEDTGTRGPNESCGSSSACVADTVCWRGFAETGYFCRALCNSSHPCGPDEMCTPPGTVNGVPPNVGLCLPLPVCGNGACEPGEDCDSCESDCGACSDDAICDSGLVIDGDPVTAECLSVNCCDQFRECTSFGEETDACVACFEDGGGPLCDASIECYQTYCDG